MEITKIETNNESTKIWALEIKDYEIETDDGKLLVQGDILIGTFTGEDNSYFHGAYFSKEKGRYEVESTGYLSKEEFENKVKQAHEINI